MPVGLQELENRLADGVLSDLQGTFYGEAKIRPVSPLMGSCRSPLLQGLLLLGRQRCMLAIALTPIAMPPY